MSIPEEGTTLDTDEAPAPPAGRQRITLPGWMMRCIHITASDPALTGPDRLAAVIICILGWAYYQRTESIDPTAVAIPAVQWETICTELAGGGAGGAVGSVNLALAFMNQGPSSYHE